MSFLGIGPRAAVKEWLPQSHARMEGSEMLVARLGAAGGGELRRRWEGEE